MRKSLGRCVTSAAHLDRLGRWFLVVRRYEFNRLMNFLYLITELSVGVSKCIDKVWCNARTRSIGRCESASIVPQADWHRQGISMRQIAQRLRRSVSTVSRELARNSITRGSYSQYIAHMRVE